MTSNDNAAMRQQPDEGSDANKSSIMLPMLKVLVAGAFLFSAVNTMTGRGADDAMTTAAHRRLTMVGDSVPKYMEDQMKDLRDRKKLFDETPPEEVKYWFEYTKPLQVGWTCF
mmetsp:Transcript_3639/g.10334  ORF Transcript_3639/g.10334 Transcript_3639/m.10334 type:complete len:113 (-) Transcript_3639:269-607(-)